MGQYELLTGCMISAGKKQTIIVWFDFCLKVTSVSGSVIIIYSNAGTVTTFKRDECRT